MSGNSEFPEGNKKEKLVLDGNSFYEIDLECVENRHRKKKPEDKNFAGSKGQR